MHKASLNLQSLCTNHANIKYLLNRQSGLIEIQFEMTWTVNWPFQLLNFICYTKWAFIFKMVKTP
jgi:hypothetical protein